MRLHAGWEWRPTLDEALAQPSLRDDLTELQRRRLTGAGTVFRQHVGAWCLAYWASFRQPPDGRVLRLRYEDLLCDPKSEMRGVFEYLGRDWDDRCLAVHRISSRTARNRQNSSVPGDNSRLWPDEVRGADRDWVERALMDFGLHELYERSP
jgi:hypothetical protein